METVNIYLSGAMAGLSWEEQAAWRNKVRNAILHGEYDTVKKPVFFSPPEYYNFNEPSHKTEKEVMRYDLYKVRNSDIIVVNLDKSQHSVGTIMELTIAHENRIPIVGLNVGDTELHPWLVESCDRICGDMRELVEYVVDFYLM